MALKSTVYKANCLISDIDRNYYRSHALTIARHPSETEERLTIRLLAFVLNANDALQFCKGLCVGEEPDLWQKTLTGDIALWIDVGLPDEKRLHKASGLADKAVIYCYGGQDRLRWQRIQNKATRYRNLSIINFPKAETDPFVATIKRTMNLQFNIEDGQIWCSDERQTLSITPEIWFISP